eukprot:c9267_g1_i1.p1 GENE.c9267_g1_i1~~c9267_g1_i1.p1  ORF type:complete len:447 (-),score=86.73 c9267_g1_i1:430-1770(-)
MASDLNSLLSSLSLSEYAGNLSSTTLEDLKRLDEEALRAHLDNAEIPTSKQGPIIEAIKPKARPKSTKQPKSDDLPAGWRALLDDKSGRYYFWNTVTNEVSWKRPVEPAVVEAPQPADAVAVDKYKPGSLSLASFNLLATLGTGSFGRVRLAQDVQTGKYIALKILKKAEIIRMKQVHHIKNEKAILEKINHPFIVNLVGYFQDLQHLYLALEYVPGGELFSLLRRKKRFNNDVSVFYAAQIVSAFAHLHKYDISYRDLKPENLLIHRDGYLKITDFGFAKEVRDDQRTYTICGTPEYLAPEIIQSRGHSKACDWWALGILIFEMLCGFPPFESDSAYGIYKKVLAGEINFPATVNKHAKDLLERLLNPKPAYRIGNLKGGVEDIKTHPWFKDLDWTALEQKRLKAPYVPKVKSENDTSNFPKYPETDSNPGQPVEEDMFPEFGAF